MCNNIVLQFSKSLLSVTAIFVLYSCSKPAEEPVVATIGNDRITAREFVLSYESSLGHLKQGATTQERKRNFLELMINERLLAAEGFARGLDEAPWIQAETAELKQELLIDALLEADVRSQITVSKEEIIAEINKSKVNFKFRFWPENDLESAQKVALRMREIGYAETVDEIRDNNPERRNIDPGQFVSDYVDYQKISPEVLEAIEALPFGEISEPVKIDNSYYIFQVLDIRRQAVTENEYNSLASRFEQVIYYTKYAELVKKYVADLMTPLNVTTKAAAFNTLSPALVEWEKNFETKNRSFYLDVLNATDKHPAMKKLRDKLDEPFFTYRDGSVSTREFLNHFKTRYVNPETANADDYKTILDVAIQFSIRDYFMVQRAQKRNMADSPIVEKGLKNWRSKWVFEESARQFTGSMNFSEDDVIDYYTRFSDRYVINKEKGPAFDYDSPHVVNDARMHKQIHILQRTSDSLKNVYNVTINEAVLDSIEVIEFEKGRWVTTRFYRGGTNRLAYPGVSENWRYMKP